MQKKENDLFLNMVANPSFSLEDFATIGFTVDNTSLQSKDAYRNNKYVLQVFSTEDGIFNEKLFDLAYKKVRLDYNVMSTVASDELIQKLIDFHRNDIYAPKEKRRSGSGFKIQERANPSHAMFGISGVNKIDLGAFSDQELAQRNAVLLNPVEASKDPSKAKWGDSPNDSWFNDFWETRVLAQWDEDGYHNDPITGEKVKHTKGEAKLNELGEYYYENLDGRSPYGKIILNKMNTITEDGSFWNLYDFFDSDDINLKSVTGSVMKNLALVGSMFIPYVGPWIAGLSVVTLLAGLLGTLGKMAVGSDNAFFSNLEGWSKSVNRQTAKTLYASDHVWCWENFINLIGDVAGLLKELRFIFENGAKLFKGFKSIPKTPEDYKSLVEKASEKIYKAKTEDILKHGITDPIDLAKLFAAARYEATNMALAQLDSFIKGYDKLGSILSKGYMTMITVGDTYGDAKLAGASDIEATLLTLGYGAAEAALLNSDIGEWILPELRMNTLRLLAIAKALTQLPEVTSTSKKNLAQRIFSKGYALANDDIARITKKWTGGFVASALGEAFEETSEELLADFSNAAFNTINWLRGDDTRMDSFGFKGGELSWDAFDAGSLFDRYTMSFVGGAVGGGLTNAFTNYRLIKLYAGMDSEKALQELVYDLRNNGKSSFIKTVKKMLLGDTNKSYRLEGAPGEIGYVTAENYADSLDAAIKKFVIDKVNMLDELLKVNGASLSDESLLKRFIDSNEILKSFRRSFIQNSSEVRNMFSLYNTLATQLSAKTSELNSLELLEMDANNNGTIEDPEKRAEESKTHQERIKALKSEISEILKNIKGLTDGSRDAEFIAAILYEGTPAISSTFLPVALPLFAESIYHQKWDKLTEEQKKQAENKYKVWKEGDAKSQIHESSQIFLEIAKRASEAIKKSLAEYLSTPDLIKKVNDLLGNYYNIDTSYGEEVFMQGALESLKADDLLPLLVKEIGTSSQISAIEQALTILLNLNTTLPNATDTKIDLLYTIDATEVDVLESYIRELRHLDFESKLNLLKALLHLKTSVQTDGATYVNTLPPPLNFNDPNDPMRLESVNNRFTLLNDRIDSMILSVNNLVNTDVEANLNEFAISVGKQEVNLTGLLALLDLALIVGKENPTAFNLDIDLNKACDDALALLLAYRSVVAAARVDNAGVNNYFGFNITMNNMLESDELITMDSDTADIIIQDINHYISKIQFALNLYKIAQSLKLGRLDIIENLKNVLFFDKLRYIVSIDDPTLNSSVDFLSFKALVNSLSRHLEVSTNKAYNLDAEAKLELELERIKLEDAIYDLFNDGNGGFKNLDILKAILMDSNNDLRLNLFMSSNDILNEDTKSFSDNSVFWYLATRAAVKASDFYGEYRLIIDLNGEKPLAPISALEIAVYTNYAAVLNRLRFNDFATLAENTMLEAWDKMSIDLKKAFLSKHTNYSTSTISNILSSPDSTLLFTLIDSLKFSSIVLTEGVAGSGKTDAVLRTTLKMLEKFHKDVLKNVAVLHGASTAGAEAILKNNKLTGQAYSRTDGMKKFCSTWTDPLKVDGIYLIDPNTYEISSQRREHISKLLPDANAPEYSLIIIDEISKFTDLDLDLLLKYANLKGITILALGDYDLVGVSGKFKVTRNGSNLEVEVQSNKLNFINTPKLGVSIRTNNSLKTENLLKVQAIIPESSWQLKLKYLAIKEGNKKGFYGDLALLGFDATGSKLDEAILLMRETLQNGEQIYYYYVDPNSSITLHIKLQYPDIIPIFGEMAQGSESRYYIVECDANKFPSNLDYNKYLYTGITRSIQGSILLQELPDDLCQLESEQGEIVSEELGLETILRYAKKKKDLYDKIVTAALNTLYTAPTLVNPSQSLPLNNPPLSSPQNNPPQNIQYKYSVGTKLEAVNAAGHSWDVFEVIGYTGDQYKLKSSTNLVASIPVSRVESSEFKPWIAHSFKYRVGNIIKYTDRYGNVVKYEVLELLSEFLGKYVLKNLNTGTIETLDANLVDNSNKYELYTRPVRRPTGSTPTPPASLGITVLGVLPPNAAPLKCRVGRTSSGLIVDPNGRFEITWDAPDALTGTITLVYPSTDKAIDSDIVEIENEDPGWDLTLVLSDGVVTRDDHGNITINSKIKIELIDTGSFGTPPPPVGIDDPDEWNAFDFLSDDEYDNLMKMIDEENANALPATPSRPSPTSLNIESLLHTFNSLETGLNPSLGLNDTPSFFSQEELDRHEKRIDSVHGLMKLLEVASLPHTTIKEYLEVIAEIQNLIIHVLDKRELTNRILTVLNNFLENRIGLSNLNIIFGLKNLFRSNQEFPNSNPNILDLGESEKSYFNLSQGSSEFSTIKHKLVMVVYDSNKNLLLELPVFTLPNPASLGLATDPNGQPLFPIALTFLQNQIAAGVPKGLFYNMIRDLQSLIKNLPGYGYLDKAIDLFTFTFRGVRFIDDPDWTPGKNLLLTGIEVVTEKGEQSVFSDYIYDADDYPFSTISLISSDPRFYVTRVYKSTTKDLQYNGYTIPNVFIAGIPCVLVTQDPDLIVYDSNGYIDIKRTDEKVKKAFYELKINGGCRVQLVHLFPPKVTFDSYLLNLFNVINKDNSSVVTLKPLPLENPFLAYKMLLILTTNALFNLVLNSIHVTSGTKTFSELLIDLLLLVKRNLLTVFDSKSKRQILENPNTSLSASGIRTGKSLVSTFERILYNVAYSIPPSTIVTGRIVPVRNDNNINLMLTILANGSNILEELFLTVKLASDSDIGEPLRDVMLENGWKFNGLDFTIKGKIIPQTLKGDITTLITDFLSSVTTDRHGVPYTTDGSDYGRGQLPSRITGCNPSRNNTQPLVNLLKQWSLYLGSKIGIIPDDSITLKYINEIINNTRPYDAILNSYIKEVLASYPFCAILNWGNSKHILNLLSYFTDAAYILILDLNKNITPDLVNPGTFYLEVNYPEDILYYLVEPVVGNNGLLISLSVTPYMLDASGNFTPYLNFPHLSIFYSNPDFYRTTIAAYVEGTSYDPNIPINLDINDFINGLDLDILLDVLNSDNIDDIRNEWLIAGETLQQREVKEDLIKCIENGITLRACTPSFTIRL